MPHHKSKVYYNDRISKYLFISSAVLVSLIILCIIWFVGMQGLSMFKEASVLDFFTSSKWSPDSGQYGALTFVVGSIGTTLIAILLGGPLGLAGAVFLAEIAPPWIRKIMRPATDLFAGIPSVVYGYVGITVVVGFTRDITKSATGYGMLAAGIVLAVMILPTVISLSEDALRSLPKTYKEASLALGATRWQTIRRVLVPAASPGILTALILAMARAIGETMAVQMVIGNSPRFPDSLGSPTSTLTSNIVMEMGNTPYGSTWNNGLFMMAFLLLIIALIMIILVRTASRKGAVR
ncbi:phosphate ABC transporter, permease protein PstC [Desulfosporosinus orientis DSM 765]|uniref:Phosphate transport system permease protein n=1 Tax=Desulfosporosinus orientis (strain ATCC 19365 / DSM 765 / NCIMB 8382 / VKM B-1628 / Singapore I) TaxID=768706 RepID=G7W991_DESOD|nr:phosphate ABC transporter permease subunit PstC [Desulfosporosinus orientis]AET68732.1 phosphate ABC transporter, permease protein PstC [Desulfosporosinus orientis DSM 765]